MNSVSVVMTVYNGERFLREQIESVLEELLPGDELVVVDDASSDGSLALLHSLVSPVLRVYANQCNLGVVASFERALKLATHDIIFLCDQDDKWLPGKRSAFVAAFKQDRRVLVVISDAQVIDAQGRVIVPSFMTSRRGFAGGVFATVWRNRYLGCAMALRRSLLTAALPIPRLVPMHDMWFGLMGRLTGKIAYLPTPLLQYRRHSSNVTSSHRQSLSRMLCWRMGLIASLCTRILLLIITLIRRHLLYSVHE